MSEAWPRHITPPAQPPQFAQPTRAPTTAEVRAMDGEPVLVTPGTSTDNPAVGMRGSIRVHRDGHVDVDLQFADMYDRPAQMKRVRLNSNQVAQLWSSKAAYGAYAVRLEGAIDAPPTGERVVGRFGRTRTQALATHNTRPSDSSREA